jgi:hypothetical protein
VTIRPSPVDMRMNLDVFSMFPSVETAVRPNQALHRWGMEASRDS